jgi:hypothetical protein
MTKNLIAANRYADEVVRQEIRHLTDTYGTAYLAGRNTWLPYHNASHAIDVHDAFLARATRLVARGELSPWAVPVGRIAMIKHDHEQGLGPGRNEDASAEDAEAALRARPDLFDEDDITMSKELIDATKNTVLNRRIIQQVDPGKNHQLLAADADLVSLSLPNGVQQAFNLLLEREADNGLVLPLHAAELRNLSIPNDKVKAFLEFQTGLLGEHRYLHPDNEREWAPQRGKNVELIRELRHAAEAGRDFGPLMDRAAAYARGNSIGRSGRGIQQ